MFLPKSVFLCKYRNIKIRKFCYTSRRKCDISSSPLILVLTLLLLAAESFLRSWQVLSWAKNSPHFMEPEGLLPHSQEAATCPFPKPDQSSPCPQTTYQRSVLILSLHLHLGLPSSPFFSGFPTKTLYAPLLFHKRATCSAYLSRLDMITRITFGEKYRT
jgi:hypothetical protein